MLLSQTHELNIFLPAVEGKNIHFPLELSLRTHLRSKRCPLKVENVFCQMNNVNVLLVLCSFFVSLFIDIVYESDKP